MKHLTIRVKKATTFWEKTLGLIPKPTAEPMLFQTRFGIHTFGMKYPIDVIILDKNGKIVKVKQHLAKNTIFLWNPLFETVVELPAGYCRQHEIGEKTIIKLLIE